MTADIPGDEPLFRIWVDRQRRVVSFHPLEGCPQLEFRSQAFQLFSQPGKAAGNAGQGNRQSPNQRQRQHAQRGEDIAQAGDIIFESLFDHNGVLCCNGIWSGAPVYSAGTQVLLASS